MYFFVVIVVYYPTIQLYILSNLLYNFIFYQHTLWAYKAVTLPWLNHTLIDLSFTFIIVPIVLMIYLRYYPKGKKQFLYMSIWVVYFTALEYLFYRKGLFVFENGWNIGWSALFNVITFTVLIVHHRNHLRGLILAAVLINILLSIFHPSLHELKQEKRGRDALMDPISTPVFFVILFSIYALMAIYLWNLRK